MNWENVTDQFSEKKYEAINLQNFLNKVVDP